MALPHEDLSGRLLLASGIERTMILGFTRRLGQVPGVSTKVLKDQQTDERGDFGRRVPLFSAGVA